MQAEHGYGILGGGLHQKIYGAGSAYPGLDQRQVAHPRNESAQVMLQIDMWMLFLKGSHVLFSSLHRLPEIGPTQLIGTWVPLCKLGATWIRLDNVVFNGVAQLGVREDRSIEPNGVALAGFLNCQAGVYS